jgi:hypothetical protein
MHESVASRKVITPHEEMIVLIGIDKRNHTVLHDERVPASGLELVKVERVIHSMAESAPPAVDQHKLVEREHRLHDVDLEVIRHLTDILIRVMNQPARHLLKSPDPPIVRSSIDKLVVDCVILLAVVGNRVYLHPGIVCKRKLVLNIRVLVQVKHDETAYPNENKHKIVDTPDVAN